MQNSFVQKLGTIVESFPDVSVYKVLQIKPDEVKK